MSNQIPAEVKEGGDDCGAGRRLCERGVPMGEGCVSGLNQPG